MHFLVALFFLIVSSTVFAEPIDVVYTWVDGSDPEWQEARDRWQKKTAGFINNGDANTRNRYRDHDELKYSLRSIHECAPFVHHIYIVTFSQVPKWLKPHPKITIVDHKDIFSNKGDLPTFNSQAIEANLHRVPDLSEKFIYFNDDVFLSSKVTALDFFEKDKLLVVCCNRKSPQGSIIDGEGSYQSSWKNTNSFLNLHFKKEERFKLAHAPFALKKSLMYELENYFPYVFKGVSSHKFRMASDFTLTNGLIQYFGIYTNRAKLKKSTSQVLLYTSDASENEKQYSTYRRKNFKFLCIEDIAESETPETELGLYTFLEYLYPYPAPWES